MKKKPIIRAIKLALLCIGFIMFNSCEEDEIQNVRTFGNPNTQHYHSHETSIISKKLHSSEFPHRQQIINNLNQLASNLNDNNLANNSFSENSNDTNSLLGLNIIQEQAEYTVYNGGHTYTFATYRDNPTNEDIIENVVFKSDGSGNYDQYLFIYALNDAEYLEFKNGLLSHNELIEKTSILNIQSEGLLGDDSGWCTVANIIIQGCDGCGGPGPCHNEYNTDEWGECVLLNQSGGPVAYITFQLQPCDNNSGSSGSGPQPPINGDQPPFGSGGSDGNTGGNTTQNPDDTGNDNNTDSGVEDPINDSPVEGSNTGFTKPIKEVIDEDFCINNLNNELSLDTEISNCLSNVSNQNICNINNDISDFLDENQSSSESILIAQEFIEILCEVPNAKWERFKELKDLIEQDPWALIQDCAQQNGMDIANYQDIYNFGIPQACVTRLDNLGEGYSNQPISEGNVPCTNIDYYSVEITQMPDLDGDGNSDTEAEVYQAFREKFTELASGEKDNFESACSVPLGFDDILDIWWEFEPLTDNDETLFLSDNPISSILKIEAGADNPIVSSGADEGAIIVSDFTPNNWTISTIQTPDTGTQPFSGNRQWGWLINENGNFEIYTRAVDVAKVDAKFLSDFAIKRLGSNLECQQETYYDIADATWQNMQQEVEDWINNQDNISNSGQATIKDTKTVHIKNEKIIEILCAEESEGTIADILNDCN